MGTGPTNSAAPTTALVIGGVRNVTTPTPADTQACALQIDASGNLLTSAGAVAPASATQLTGAPAQSAAGSLQTPVTNSATGAAAAIAAILPAAAAKFTYITGFQVTGAGATAASVIVVTVTGVVGGTMSFDLAVPVGATVGATPLIVSFPIPIPSSAVNTAIAVNVPSFGAGNTNAAVSAQGFQE